MNIENKSYDKVDTTVTVIENGKDVKELQGVYYYFLDDELMYTAVSSGTANNSEVLGLSEAIRSLTYVPYMNTEHMNLDFVQFDTERYGWEKQSGGGSTEPYVYRITRYPTNKTLNVNPFLCYKKEGLTIGGRRNWKNESRLYDYPYSFGVLTDFIADNFQFKFHLCKQGNLQEPFVRTTLSNFGTYNFGILGYKNDVNGQIEGVVNNKSLDLPNSSSAYSNWASTSRSQTDVNQAIGFFQGVNNAVGGAFSLNPQGLINAGISIAGNIGLNMAMKNDLKTTPRSMISLGADVNFSKALSGARKLQEKGGLYFMRFGITDEYAEKLGNFFAMYGYLVNKVMTPNFRSRKYYNYIEVKELNILGNDIPKIHMQKIKDVFEKGITFWHVKNGPMFDYSKDNVEI